MKTLAARKPPLRLRVAALRGVSGERTALKPISAQSDKNRLWDKKRERITRSWKTTTNT